MGNVQPVEQNNTSIEVVCQNGSYMVDSRVLAVRLGYEHKIILQSIRRHKARLEAKSVVLQFEAKPPKGSVGGRPEVYYMLDERQCLILAGSLKKGEEADEWHDHLVDAFLQARHRVQELERQPVAQPPIYLSDALRQRAFANEKRVPPDCFSTQLELARELHYWERLLNETLDNKSEIEKSVGRVFSGYARAILHIPEDARRTYRHQLPNGLMVDPWAYPLRYLPAFRTFLREVYFPEKFPAYARSRARRIGAPIPQIAAPKKRALTNEETQLQLF